MASVSLGRAAVDRRAATCFQREVFLLNDSILKSDIMPSDGGSVLSEGGSVRYEVVILTEGFNILSEGSITPPEVVGRRISGAWYLFWRRRHPFACEA